MRTARSVTVSSVPDARTRSPGDVGPSGPSRLGRGSSASIAGDLFGVGLGLRAVARNRLTCG